MLNRIIEFSIKNKLIIGLFVLALIGYGAYEIKQLPIDAVPDITNNQVQVITSSPSLGAPDIERLVTFPIEQANTNIKGLKEIRSFSRFGLSVVTLVFDDDIDVYWARQQVAERLQMVKESIPPEFGLPEIAPLTTGLGEIYQYVVRPKKGYEHKFTPTELRTIQDWIVRRQLLGVKGVADVASFGGNLKQYEVAVDPGRLQATGANMKEVFEALQNNNQNTGGAYIEKGPSVLFIRSEGLIDSLKDIENIVVKNLPDGTPLLIRNLAQVGYGSATRYGAMTYNGEGEVAGAVVMMLKGDNSNVVIRNVKDRIEQIKKTLPEGVVIDPFLDRTKMVNNSISTVTTNLLEGALIVIFVLVFFLGNLRAGLLVASVIPLSMLFAIIMMNIFGVSGNLMSLGALDFGLIVDGAVIIVEAVMHRLTRNQQFSSLTRLSQKEMDTAVAASSGKMMNSAVFGQIIILIVYLPIFTFEGIEGKMFMPMAQTVAFALIGAFFLSLTYIPMMSSLVLSRQIKEDKNMSERLMDRLEHLYERSLNRALTYKRTILTGMAVLFAIALFIFSTLGGEFIPSLPEGDFAVDTRVLPGSNLKTSVEAVLKSEKILLERFPEVEKVVGKTGSSEIPTDPMAIDASDMMVILKPRKEWTTAKTYNELMEKMGVALEEVVGVTYGFQYPVAMRFNELMTGARQDVVCKLFGEDLDTLELYASKLNSIVNTVDGARDLYVEPIAGLPQIVVKYRREAIARYGLTISDVNKMVNTAFAGQPAGMVYEGEKRFEVVVRLPGGQRQRLEDVQNLLIPLPGGLNIPLSALAVVDIVNGPNQIQRENAQRRVVVGFNVRDRDIQTVVKEVQSKAEARLQLPPGYYIHYGGAFENLNAARDRLSIAVPVALLLIFILLYFAFGSVKYGLIIFTAIPLSAIGGILGLAARGMPFSISAGIGFIALFGVSVLNGIVLVAEFNRQKQEGSTQLKDKVIRGAKTRLRPVLMTACVAALGFLPMALSNGEGAEVQRPLATVVIGGLLLATFLTLFVLPVLYIFVENGFSFKKKAPAAVLVAVLLLLAPAAGAQTPIGLQQAIEIALKNNESLRSERLRTAYLKHRQGMGADIPQTSVEIGYGQINSNRRDNSFTIGQSIKFPTVYARQKDVLTAEWHSGMLGLTLKENELEKQLSTVYYQWLYLLQKEALLLESDSIYSAFLSKAALRFEKGESNVLEKATAETQKDQIARQLAETRTDLQTVKLQFALLINTDTPYCPKPEEARLPAPHLADTASLSLHPALRQASYQLKVSDARLKLEKARMLPDLLASYSNMSMKELQAANPQAPAGRRFHSFQAGLGIPLFTTAQRASVRAAKADRQLSESLYLQSRLQLSSSLLQARLVFARQSTSLAFIETKALKNAELIVNTANTQFAVGEINYLEWTLLVNNAISIRTDYIDALKNYNLSIIELNALQTK